MAEMNRLTFIMGKKVTLTSLLPLMFLGGISFFMTKTVEAAETAKDMPDVKYYQTDNKTNQIPYFDNRFRIDAEIKEITLLFYRKRGARPVILVRPDGSKLRVDNYPNDRVEWYDDATFDMIKIKNPVPGPWQVVGNVLPESQIMVVTDVEIAVDPLPEVIISGETLKITARLFNHKKSIESPEFRDVVTLNVDFLSTNNPNFDNFGAEPERLTTFKDDGKNLDEHARDGVFTGEFELVFAPGEWLPVYSVKLPMAKRELQQKAVILQPNPISLSAIATTEKEEVHKVTFSISPDHVDVDSIVFQGKITFPNKHQDPFSIAEGTGKERTIDFPYADAGIHIINVNAYGRTHSGREFRMIVPEFTFNVEETFDDLLLADEDLPPSPAEIERLKAIALAADIAALKQEAEDDKQNMVTFIIIANIVIVIIALIVFFIMRKGGGKKKLKVEKEKKKKDKKVKK
jgi:uncharacterized protein (TIGR03503 family)